jgi:hypothetical protein
MTSRGKSNVAYGENLNVGTTTIRKRLNFLENSFIWPVFFVKNLKSNLKIFCLIVLRISLGNHKKFLPGKSERQPWNFENPLFLSVQSESRSKHWESHSVGEHDVSPPKLASLSFTGVRMCYQDSVTEPILWFSYVKLIMCDYWNTEILF